MGGTVLHRGHRSYLQPAAHTTHDQYMSTLITEVWDTPSNSLWRWVPHLPQPKPPSCITGQSGKIINSLKSGIWRTSNGVTATKIDQGEGRAGHMRSINICWKNERKTLPRTRRRVRRREDNCPSRNSRLSDAMMLSAYTSTTEAGMTRSQLQRCRVCWCDCGQGACLLRTSVSPPAKGDQQ